MFRWFRSLLEGINAIPIAILGVRDTALEAIQSLERPSEWEGDAEINSRLDALEKSRALWEAEMEAMVLKAEGHKHSANNAEARARTTLKNAKKLGYDDDEGGLESEEELLQAYKEMGWVPGGNAEGSAPEPMLGLRSHVEGEPAKARALRAKYGG